MIPVNRGKITCLTPSVVFIELSEEEVKELEQVIEKPGIAVSL